jgi:predicted CopG family antitoxin
MADTTTIEIKKTTHAKLVSIGDMGESFDAVVNRLIQDHEEIDKHIVEFVKNKNGVCVFEKVLGRCVIANHVFNGDTCEKCGLSTPDMPIFIGSTRRIGDPI